VAEECLVVCVALVEIEVPEFYGLVRRAGGQPGPLDRQLRLEHVVGMGLELLDSHEVLLILSQESGAGP
jgi:hypothetical protein